MSSSQIMSTRLPSTAELAQLPVELFLEIVDHGVLLVGVDLYPHPLLEAMKPYPRHHKAVSRVSKIYLI
jgi:hypothetical protein